MSDLHTFVQQTKMKHQGKVDPLPEFATYETFVYAPDQLRDPFKPQTDQMASDAVAAEYTGPRPEQGRRKEPLETFPLDSLKMVGLLQQKDQTWGLVKDPNGTIHRIQPGNYAGQNNGKIQQVEETSISILELVPDGLSGWVNRNAKLAMREE
ncbi:MAG: pilus assembly protein PilP [Gammaproteobacteria bacterium]|nr:pilus assembly protein PilP [Gammaproteobacteria bacterium]